MGQHLAEFAADRVSVSAIDAKLSGLASICGAVSETA